MSDRSDDVKVLGPFMALCLKEKLVITASVILLWLASTVSGIVRRLFGLKWIVGESDRIERVCDNLWTVRGGSPMNPLFAVRMTIIRLSNSKLLIHSALFCSEELVKQVEELGELEYIYVPSTWHDSFAAGWKARFPEAKVVCTERSIPDIEPLVEVAGPAEKLLGQEGFVFHRFDHLMHGRFAHGESVLEVPAEGLEYGNRALIFCDVMQNSHSGDGWFVSLPLGWYGTRVARFYKCMGVRDRAGLLEFLESVTSKKEGLAGALFSHGPPLFSPSAGPALAASAARHLSSAIINYD